MTVQESTTGMTRQAVEQLSASKNEPDWMRDQRLRAWQIYEMLPMPSRTDEEWRRTDLRGLDLEALTPFAEPSGSIEPPLGLEDTAGGTITQRNSVTIDHTLHADLAQQGVVFTDLDTALREHPDLVRQYFMTQAVTADYNKFTALNAAFWSGGVFLYVPRGVEVTLPLRAFYGLTAGGAALFTHTLIVLEPGARAIYVEEYAANGVSPRSLNAGVVEVVCKRDAHLTLVTLQDWMGDVYDLSVQRAVQEQDSTVDWLVIGLGNGLTRTNLDSALAGAGARSQMLGILWGYARQHTAYHTLQDHIAPHTTSDLLYKGALQDEATSVFTGRIRVSADAMHTDAYQANRSVLLSPKAKAFPSPNLEIGANEVRCTHGASVGRVDQDQLFYLMSRGMPREVATRMIVEGFFEDVLQREPVDVIRDNLRDLIMRKMDETQV